MKLKIKIKHLPAINLAGINAVGLNNVASAYDRLIKRAVSFGLTEDPDFKLVTVYQDSAKDTAYKDVRFSACFFLSRPIKCTGELTSIILNPERCIVASMEIKRNEFEQSWKDLYTWMNAMEYRPSQEKPFEIFYNNVVEHPQQKCIVDLCVPIEK